jgi:hypothetical protein
MGIHGIFYTFIDCNAGGKKLSTCNEMRGTFCELMAFFTGISNYQKGISSVFVEFLMLFGILWIFLI